MPKQQKIPASKIPTIGGGVKDHQSAQMIVQYLKPILEQLGEQMAAFDVIQDDIIKRVDKLEARNKMVITHTVDDATLNRLGYPDRIGAKNEHEMPDKKTSKA